MTDSKIVAAALMLGLMAAFSSAASAKTCNVTIEGNDQMKFDKDQIAVAADCTEVAVTLKHAGKLPVAAMGHNWVLTEGSAFQAVTTAGMTAGPTENYIPKGDARVIAHTKLVGGGETATVKFPTSKLKKGGDYLFFCSFPGHWAVMKGKFTFG